MKEEIKEQKNGKTPGHDKLTTKIMKTIGQKGEELFSRCLELCAMKNST